jgi:predicted MFS family arabinose efflux permease
MSFALTVQAVGGLIGAILCGLIFDHVNPELAFAIASLVQGLSHILAPYIGGLEPFMIAVCVQATSIGFILTSIYLFIYLFIYNCTYKNRRIYFDYENKLKCTLYN